MLENKIQILGYSVFAGSLEDIDLNFSTNLIINTINPHSYVVARTDVLFKQALQSSNILLPDGTGIVLAARWLKNKKILKIAGADIHSYLLEKAQKEKLKVFYLGASRKTLQLIETRLKKEHPDIIFNSYSPPYKNKFSDDDSEMMIMKVNAFQPDILFVGMTAPKQEKWVYRFKERIDAKIIVSIGAVFDFYSGTVKRPSQFWISLGLEWLPRFIKEPGRLWKRNFISTPLFLLELVKAKLIK